MAWGLTDTPDTAALVIVSGATMPWPGGLGPYYAVTGSRIGAATVIPAITAFASPAQADRVIAGIFAPDAPPEGYGDYVGAGLTMRRDTLRINARPGQPPEAPCHPHGRELPQTHPARRNPARLRRYHRPGTDPRHPACTAPARCSLTLLPDAAHMPHHTHPEAVIAAIHRAATRAGLR
jgi:pimeloyl-ACP methyl ester carboxylesterase